MAITEDASSPGSAATGTGVGTIAQTFSPPAGTLLVALTAAGYGTAVQTASISDTASLSWTSLVQAQGTVTGTFGVCAIFCTYLTSAPGSLTVTTSFTNFASSSSAGGRYLWVKVLNGANPVQSSATAFSRTVGSGAKSTTATEITVTTTQVGSMVYGISADPENNFAFTAISGTTTLQSFSDSTDGVTIAGWKSTNATTTPGSATFGGDLATADESNVAAFEVLPASLFLRPLVSSRAVTRAAFR